MSWHSLTFNTPLIMTLYTNILSLPWLIVPWEIWVTIILYLKKTLIRSKISLIFINREYTHELNEFLIQWSISWQHDTIHKWTSHCLILHFSILNIAIVIRRKLLENFRHLFAVVCLLVKIHNKSDIAMFYTYETISNFKVH